MPAIKNIQSTRGHLEDNAAASTANQVGVSAHQRSVRQVGLTSRLKNALFARVGARRPLELSSQPAEKISTMRVIAGIALSVGVGAAVGGPVGIGLGVVVGAAYILVGPQAMWNVAKNATRAVAVHATQRLAGPPSVSLPLKTVD